MTETQVQLCLQLYRAGADADLGRRLEKMRPGFLELCGQGANVVLAKGR